MAEQTVFVTGGSRGIGLAVCRRLVEQGYNVVALARRDTEELARLRADHGDRVRFIEADLLDDGDLDRVCAALRSCSTLFGLVNNAGIAVAGLHVSMRRASMARMFCLNVQTPMILSQAGVKAMSRNHTGRIVNVSSISAHRAYRGLAVYGATKNALEGFSAGLAVEVGRWGITVNCVAPGYVDTDMNAELPDDLRARVRRREVLPVGPDGEHVANAVAFLLSPAAATITAEVIRVDSGATA